MTEVSHETLVLMLQHVSSRVSGFPVASPCLWGKLQNLSCFKVPKQVITRFCVASVALLDIPMCLQTCRASFCLAGAILLRPLHSTVYTPHFTLYTPHYTLHTLHSTLYTSHFTLHAPHSTLHTLHFTLHTLYTPHSLHFTLQNLHSTLYTPHSTLFN